MRWALLLVSACSFSANNFGGDNDAPIAGGDTANPHFDAARIDGGPIDARAIDAHAMDAHVISIDAHVIDAFVFEDAPPPPKCPADFAAIAGAPSTSVYKIYSYSIIPGDNLSEGWNDAEATCKAQGAHLMIADTAGEAAAVGAKIAVPLLFPYYSDGVSAQAVAGTWLDVLGHPADYLPWYPGQPNGANGGPGPCTILDKQGALFDYYCDSTHKYPFACECEP